MGLFNLFKKKSKEPYDEILPPDEVNKLLNQEIDARKEERNNVIESADLTPNIFAGKKRRYHYKDVNICVSWQYSGHYDKSCESIGMKRGDPVELLPSGREDVDPDTIAIYWKNTEIGIMKANRMQGMIKQWKSAGLPVLAVVSQVGGYNKLFIEISFYGYVKKDTNAKA